MLILTFGRQGVVLQFEDYYEDKKAKCLGH